jgi:hypothetical protein
MERFLTSGIAFYSETRSLFESQISVDARNMILEDTKRQRFAKKRFSSIKFEPAERFLTRGIAFILEFDRFSNLEISLSFNTVGCASTYDITNLRYEMITLLRSKAQQKQEAQLSP